MDPRHFRIDRIICLACTFLAFAAGPAPAQTPEPPPPLAANVFDVLTTIEKAPDPSYSTTDVLKILHAVWWDLSFAPEEAALARALSATERPIIVTATDGRTLTFTKLPDNDASRQQRFLLPRNFDAANSSYFMQVFRNTKDVGVYVAASRVHENAAEIMEAALTEMVNQARAAAKTKGDEPMIQLFDSLDAARREANPEIQAEFAAAVRRVVLKFDSNPKALPKAVRDAVWLQAPGG